MTLLYSAKCSVNLRSAMLMFNFSKQKSPYSRLLRTFPSMVELLTFYSNVILGYFYINEVDKYEIFEAIIFGFIVIETPEFVLKFVT